MPSLGFHMSLAWETALRLGDIEVEKGCYLFASTLPDIHLITNLSREETHLFKLGEEPEGRALALSLRRRFKAEGHITKALGAGYLSHLIGDIIWIQEIYRPFFSPSSPLGGDPLADLLDRTLQYELDLEERENRERMHHIHQALLNLTLEGLEFMDIENLKQWHDFILVSLEKEPSWERFPHFVYSLLLKGKVRKERVEDFLSSLPAMIDRVLKYVPRDRLNTFREKVISQSVLAIKEYFAANSP